MNIGLNPVYTYIYITKLSNKLFLLINIHNNKVFSFFLK